MQADRGGSEAPRNFADLDRGGRSGGKGGRGGGKGGGRAGGLPTGGRFGDGNESAGYITTLKENFGFIERARDAAGASGAGENIFFHFSAVCGGAGPSIGDEVSFTVAADRRTGRDAATLVTLLPKGTLPPPPRGGGLPREQGMVISLKDKFGFIRSETVPGQLFFHFSEAPRDEKGGKAEAAGDSGGKADGAGRGKAPLRVGDEVSFIRVTDAQSQKMAGTKLAALPPGTVRFETIEEAVMRGVVTRAAPGADRQTRMLSRRDKAQQGGLIRLLGEPCTDAAAGGVGVGTQAVDGGDAVHGASSQEGGRVGGASTVDDATAEEAVEAVEALSVTDGAAGAGGQVPGADAAAVASGRGGRGSASLCFGLDDVDDGCGELCVGDEVTFRRAIDRATGEVGAAHVVLVTAQWRRGFVTSFREGEGGMVRPSAGGASLPFDHHVSTLHGPSEGEPQGMHDTHESAPSDLRAVGDGDLRVGSEVEYRRSSDSRTKRACATCVWRLPPGSIVLEWVWPVRWEAELVSAPPRGAQPAGRKGQQGGGGQAVGLVQLKRPWRPEGHVGGAEIGASAGGEEAVQGGEAAQGVEAAEASGRIQLEMGQFCVPAALTAGTRASGGSGDAAFGSGGAAGGHGATQETSGGGVRAKPEAAALRAIASLAAGCVVAPLPLPLSVLADSRTTLNTGDTLSVQIAISASDGALRLCRAALLASAPGAYERGMVTNAKHDYGFLRAEGRAGVVFFHFSELPTRTHQVRPGDEFEFVVSTAPAVGSNGAASGGASAASKRATAIRLRPLPPGTVQFEEVLLEAATGVVEMVRTGGEGDAVATAGEGHADEEAEWVEEAGGAPAAEGGGEAADGGASTGGSGRPAGALLVRLDQEYEGERLALPPSRRELDTYLRGALPAAGCAVACSLARSKRDGKLVLINVHPVPLAGTIRSCHGATGVIRAAAPLPPAAVEIAEKARTADAASEQAAAPDTSGLQDLVGSGATWGRAEAGATTEEDGRAAAAGGASRPAPVTAAAAAVYISAGQSPFANAAPTVKTTSSRLAQLAATHADGRSQQVPFGFGDTVSDPKKEARLGVGDAVEFVLCADPKTLQLVARRVRLTKEAAEPEAPEYTKRQVDPAKVTRFAKGPDGTKGFAMDRGKFLAPASAATAEA